MKTILTAIGVINLIGFLLMGIDKLKSKYGFWRIKERTLLGIALTFGSAGVYLGMVVFRHKTKHKSFKITLPLLTVIHAVVILWLFYGSPFQIN